MKKTNRELEMMTQRFLTRHSKGGKGKKVQNMRGGRTYYMGGDPLRDFSVVPGSFENGKKR